MGLKRVKRGYLLCYKNGAGHPWPEVWLCISMHTGLDIVIMVKNNYDIDNQ